MSYRFGMYRGEEVLESARKSYFRSISRLMIVPVRNELGADLQALPSGPSPNDDFGDAYQVLKAYLLITSETNRNEPALTDFLWQYLLMRWSRTGKVSDDQLALARGQLQYYSSTGAALVCQPMH